MATKLIDYGFDDFTGWNGSVSPAPGYIFSTNDENAYWLNYHMGSVDVITGYGGNLPYEGTHYHHHGMSSVANDPALGHVAAYANAYMNIGLNSTYPTGTKETATLSSITSGVCVIRFYFRCTDTWETNVGAPGVNGGVLGNLKWLRFYGNSGSQADTDGCFVHVTRGHDTNAEGSSFRILDYSNDCTWHYYRTGVDIQDGNWHSCCTKITRLNTTNTNPNLNTKVWWDDWDMSGDPKCDRNVYHSTWGTNFSYLSMHQNWSGTVPQLAMGIDLDKVEVWDDAPEVGNPEVSALQCEGETTPGAVTDITPEFSAYVTKGANNVSKMEIQVSATDAFDGDLVYDSGSLNLDPVLTDSGRTDDKSYGD